MKTVFVAVFITAACLLSTSSAHAGPIAVNTWYNFGFNEDGSPLVTPFEVDGAFGAVAVPDAGPWTFTLAGEAELFWTDIQISGDRFEFFDFGVSIGASGPDVVFGSAVGTCIACALADSNFGKGSVSLGAGNHSLSGTFLGVVGYGDGAFIIRDRAVPEPAAVALLGVGLAAAAVVRRRRRS